MCSLDLLPDVVNLGFSKEVNGLIECGAITCRMLVMMVEIAVHRNMNISTIIQEASKVLSSEACRNVGAQEPRERWNLAGKGGSDVEEGSMSNLVVAMVFRHCCTISSTFFSISTCSMSYH